MHLGITIATILWLLRGNLLLPHPNYASRQTDCINACNRLRPSPNKRALRFYRKALSLFKVTRHEQIG